MDKLHLCPPSHNSKSKKNTLLMSADSNTLLFEISDGDNATYEDDPAVIQARENLAVAEHV